MITRLTAHPDGRVWKTEYSEAGGVDLAPPRDFELDVDTDTNAALLDALDTDATPYAIADGVLIRDGEPVTINPPAPVPPIMAERVVAALLDLPELSAASKAKLVAALEGPG
jgi:hypothetical protein